MKPQELIDALEGMTPEARLAFYEELLTAVDLKLEKTITEFRSNSGGRRFNEDRFYQSTEYLFLQTLFDGADRFVSTHKHIIQQQRKNWKG